MYYRCMACACDFLAWHEATVTQDASELTGMLSFRLSHGFVVDNELYSFIVNHTNNNTASIHQKLKRMLADAWMSSATHCYRAVLAGRVNQHNPNFLEGTNQSKLMVGYFKAPKLTDA